MILTFGEIAVGGMILFVVFGYNIGSKECEHSDLILYITLCGCLLGVISFIVGSIGLILNQTP